MRIKKNINLGIISRSNTKFSKFSNNSTNKDDSSLQFCNKDSLVCKHNYVFTVTIF